MVAVIFFNQESVSIKVLILVVSGNDIIFEVQKKGGFLQKEWKYFTKSIDFHNLNIIYV